MIRLALAAALLAPVAAQARETAAFLRLQPGARPLAMGEAFTAVAEGLDSLTTNPAGLAVKPERQASFSHAELFDSTKLDFAAYGQPLGGPDSAAALSVRRLSYGTLQGRDASRNSTGGFEASDLELAAGYARTAREGLVVGAAAKYIDSRLAETHARGFAVDAGAVWSREARGVPVSLGASVRNLGPAVRRDRESESLPLAASVGVAARPSDRALVSADLAHRPNAAATTAGFGGELAVVPEFKLRAGYLARLSGQTGSAGGATGLGAGFGLKIARFGVDYAFAPYGELGDSHRLTLTLRF